MNELKIINVNLFGEKFIRLQINNDIENSHDIKNMSKKAALKEAKRLFNIDNLKNYRVISC